MRKNLVDYIVLTEFDINEGSAVRIVYPGPLHSIDTQSIADNMIPEGSHNFGVLTSNFVLGRKTVKELQTDQNRVFASTGNLMQRLLPPDAVKQLRAYIDDTVALNQEAKLYKLKAFEWVPINEKNPSATFDFSFVKSGISSFSFKFVEI